MKLTLNLLDCHNTYYDCMKCDSYNMFFNILISARSVGKTSRLLTKGCKYWNDTGKPFIYVRRYKKECTAFIRDPVLKKVTDGVISKNDGNGGYKLYVCNSLIGHVIPLSTAVERKSSDYEQSDFIIYDEAILKPRQNVRYLNDEVQQFLDLCYTILRLKTTGHIYIAGNNLDMFNPFFQFFNVPLFDNIFVDRNRGLYCEYINNNPNFIKMQEATPMFKLTQGTSYHDYSYDNKVLTDNSYKIIDRPSSLSLFCRLLINGLTLNVYLFTINGNQSMYVERKDKYIRDSITYEILKGGAPNYYDIKLYRYKIRDYINSFYYSPNIYYSDIKAGGAMDTIINLM